jgi:hypothetical protein
MALRNILLVLLFFLGLGGILGGAMFIISPSGELIGMPLSFLNNSPFKNFLIPGILLFVIIGIAPVAVAFALIIKPVNKVLEAFNFFKDMYWAWAFTIYIAFALIIWIQVQMMMLRAVHWLHSFYVFFAVAIIFTALLPEVRNRYKK